MLNGYMYSNGSSLNVAIFVLMANHSRITLQIIGSLIVMQLKQKYWRQSSRIALVSDHLVYVRGML